MYRSLIFFFIIIQQGLFASEPIDYKYVETLSKTYFEQNDYKNLNKIGNLAIKHHIDYFYLRMRLGIASYNRKNYVKATNHFEHALRFNSGDSAVVEYLYYCYVFTGNENEAMRMAKKMPKTKQNRIKTLKPKIIESVSLQGAYQINSSYTKQISETAIIPKFALKRDLNKSFQFYTIGLNHHFFRRFTISQSLSILDMKNTLYPFTPIDSSFDGNTKQQQYYVMGKYSVCKNVEIGVGAQLLKTATDWVGYNTTNKTYEIQTSNPKSHLYFYTLGLRYKYLQLSFFNGFSNLNSKTQKQYTFSLFFFPRGNTNIYIGKELTIQQSESVSYFAKQSMGWKLPKVPCWLEVFFANGNIKNYSEANGSVVFNGKQATLLKIGSGLIVPLFNNKCIVNVNWIYEQKEPTLPYDYSFKSFSNPRVNLLNSNHQTFVGGITFKL